MVMKWKTHSSTSIRTKYTHAHIPRMYVATAYCGLLIILLAPTTPMESALNSIYPSWLNSCYFLDGLEDQPQQRFQFGLGLSIESTCVECLPFRDFLLLHYGKSLAACVHGISSYKTMSLVAAEIASLFGSAQKSLVHADALSKQNAHREDASMHIVLSFTFLKCDGVTHIYINTYSPYGKH